MPQEAEASEESARASHVRPVVQVHSRLVKPPALLGPLSSMLRTAWQKWFVSRPRLNLPYECGAPERSLLAIVPDGSQWRVVFGLSLRNDGRREARNWRLRFQTPDHDTMMFLDQQADRRRVNETWAGPGWQYEVVAASAHDTVQVGLSVVVHGAHALSFTDKPASVSLKCWTSADDSPVREETLVLDLDWTSMTARFRFQG